MCNKYEKWMYEFVTFAVISITGCTVFSIGISVSKLLCRIWIKGLKYMGRNLFLAVSYFRFLVRIKRVLLYLYVLCRMKGVYDALDQEYLKALIFAVCILISIDKFSDKCVLISIEKFSVC